MVWGFWRRFWSDLRVELYPDTFALRREALWEGIRTAIERRREQDDLILLVTHFPATFLEAQERLESWGIEPVASRVGWRPEELPWARIGPDGERGPAPVLLVLSEMLQGAREDRVRDARRSVAMMVLERHPLSRSDERLLAFAKGIPAVTRLGHFASLEDDSVGPFVGDWTEMLLRQWGMRQVDLVTSDLVARRLTRARVAMDREIREEESVESARQWLEVHGGRSRYRDSIRRWLDRKDTATG